MSNTDSATEKLVRDYLIEKALNLKESNRAGIDKRAAAAAGRDLLYMQELDKSLSKVFHKGWCTTPKYTGKRQHSPHKRIVNILLSDLHLGAHLDPQECPIEYNTVQESRRLGRVAVQVADYKRYYRKETKLIIHMLGDMIQGMLGHDPRDGEPLQKQFNMALSYLIQFVLFEAAQYPSVEIYCTPGNHGRNIARHQEKAVHQKWDSIENMLYVALRAAVYNSGVGNCKFFIPKTPYYIAPLFGSKLFGTHGDTVLRPGYPGRSINVANLAQQVCKWNTARNVGGPFDIFAVGHIHTATMVSLPGNVTLVTNGCLVPPDPFALSIGTPDNTCSQWMFESVEGHAIGDQRFIVVDGAENESKYNDIIKPFEDL
jgi:hypothetical protein